MSETLHGVHFNSVERVNSVERPGTARVGGAAERHRWRWPEVLALTVVCGGVVVWRAGLIDLAALLPF